MASSNSNRKPPGRPRGSVNRVSEAFADKIKAKGFDLVEAFLELHREGMKTYREGHDDHKMEGAKIALAAVKEMASYMLPKLQSISISKEDPLEGMTPQQKLEAMREAIKLMEAEQEKEVKKIGV